MTKPSLDLKKKNWELRWQKGFRARRCGRRERRVCGPFTSTEKRYASGEKYVHCLDPSFAYSLHLTILRALFLHHIPGAASYTELGSGTGINLFLLSKLFPGAAFLGTDWSKNSVLLMDAVAAAREVTLTGSCLDLRTMEGGETIQIPPDGVILTIHALEQIGACYERCYLFFWRSLLGWCSIWSLC